MVAALAKRRRSVADQGDDGGAAPTAVFHRPRSFLLCIPEPAKEDDEDQLLAEKAWAARAIAPIGSRESREIGSRLEKLSGRLHQDRGAAGAQKNVGRALVEERRES